MSERTRKHFTTKDGEDVIVEYPDAKNMRLADRVLDSEPAPSAAGPSAETPYAEDFEWVASLASYLAAEDRVDTTSGWTTGRSAASVLRRVLAAAREAERLRKEVAFVLDEMRDMADQIDDAGLMVFTPDDVRGWADALARALLNPLVVRVSGRVRQPPRFPRGAGGAVPRPVRRNHGDRMTGAPTGGKGMKAPCICPPEKVDPLCRVHASEDAGGREPPDDGLLHDPVHKDLERSRAARLPARPASAPAVEPRPSTGDAPGGDVLEDLAWAFSLARDIAATEGDRFVIYKGGDYAARSRTLSELREALADISPCDLICKPGGGVATEIRSDSGLRPFATSCDCGPCRLAVLLERSEP